MKFETAKEEENFSPNMASRAYKTLPSAFRKDSSNGQVKRVSSDSHRYVRLFVYLNFTPFINNVLVIYKPISYIQTLTLISNSKFIVTDSGGVLREAYFLKNHL